MRGGVAEIDVDAVAGEAPRHTMSSFARVVSSFERPHPAPREVPMAAIQLSGFKQTYWSGHHHPQYAEPALRFPITQSPEAAIDLLGGSTTGKLILCTVPNNPLGTNRHNDFAGKIYAVVEVWAVDRPTRDILNGYPAPPEVLDFWITHWPRCLPIRRWYDLRTPRFFSEIHPDALREAQIARGRLRTLAWLTEAAALDAKDLCEREVFVTPALRTIVAMFT
jgi:hypothetical protein